MLINWFTVAAQIVNFLILVALLKHFLYGPIVAAMTAREGKIAAQLTEAREKRQQAEQEEASLRQKIREIGEQRQAMLTEAGHQAEAHKTGAFHPGPAGSGADSPEMGGLPGTGKSDLSREPQAAPGPGGLCHLPPGPYRNWPTRSWSSGWWRSFWITSGN